MAIFILPGKSPFALTLATSRVIVHPPPMPTVLFTVVHPAHVGELLRWGWQERRWRVLSSAPRLWHFTEKEQMVTCSAKPHNKLLSPACDLYSGRGQAHSSSLFICCRVCGKHQEGSHCHQVSRSHRNFSHRALACLVNGCDTTLLWKWVP